MTMATLPEQSRRKSSLLLRLFRLARHFIPKAHPMPPPSLSETSARSQRRVRDILWSTLKEFNDDDIMSIAAGVTFYALLALFPGIAALISLYGLFADPGTIWDHLTLLSGFLPGGAMDLIGDEVRRVASQEKTSLGFGFFIGLGTALWSASAGAKALCDALNVAYERREKRGFVMRSVVALIFTCGGILFLMLALGAVVGVPIVLNFVGLASASKTLMEIVRWPALFCIALFFLGFLYRYGPSRTQGHVHWFTWGGALAATLWVGGSFLFSWYVEHFGNYNKTYGSLGAAVGFMTWIWLSTTVFLLGAELNAEIEDPSPIGKSPESPPDPNRSPEAPRV